MACSTAGSEVKTGTYHGMIHEMNGNGRPKGSASTPTGTNPSTIVIYLYDYAGQPWKTQLRVRQVMNQLYQSTPDGISGDEDNGQMSAWYVFSALGLYPVCPGSDAYAIGSPLFDRATLTVGTNRQFGINTRDNGPQRFYINSASLNHQPFNQVFLTHNQIVTGGEINFEMTSFPNYSWAIDEKARPPAALSLLHSP